MTGRVSLSLTIIARAMVSSFGCNFLGRQWVGAEGLRRFVGECVGWMQGLGETVFKLKKAGCSSERGPIRYQGPAHVDRSHNSSRRTPIGTRPPKQLNQNNHERNDATGMVRRGENRIIVSFIRSQRL